MLSLILCAHSMQLNYDLPLMLTLSACETALQGEFKISFTSPWAFLQADMYVECSAVGLERKRSDKKSLFLTQYIKGIVIPKMNIYWTFTHSQAIQDVDFAS